MGGGKAYEVEKGKMLEQILKENGNRIVELTRLISTVIPQLLDHVIELTKTFPTAHISNEYPHNHNGKIFTKRYIIDQGRIYKTILDPSADVMDSGDSYETEVSKKEFLDWVGQNLSNRLDVYNHIVQYAQKLPAYKKLMVCEDKKHLEAINRYP